MTGDERHELPPLSDEKRPTSDEQSAGARSGNGRGDTVEFAFVCDFDNDDLASHRLRGRLQCLPFGFCSDKIRLKQLGHDRGPGNELIEQPKPFATERDIEKADAGDVTARPMQAGDKTASYRILAADKDNRYRLRGGHGSGHRGVIGDDHGYFAEVWV